MTNLTLSEPSVYRTMHDFLFVGFPDRLFKFELLVLIMVQSNGKSVLPFFQTPFCYNMYSGGHLELNIILTSTVLSYRYII